MKLNIPGVKTCFSRRSLLKNALIGSLAQFLPVGLMAQQALILVPLRNNIYMISGAGCNVIVAVSPDSVVVVDGGLQDYAGELLQEINNLAQGKGISTLFNTNWRREHCGLNYVLGPAGTNIIAHENTRLWQNNDFFVNWEDRHYSPMPRISQANKTFYKSGSLATGSEAIEYGLISECHTDGDIFINFKDSNVLVVGDMLTVGTYPLLDYITGGWIGGAQEATVGLLDLADADTLIIPASGGVQKRAALEVQQQMLDHAFEKVSDAYRNGRSLEEFMASAPMAEYEAIYGDSALFEELLYRGIWFHVTSRAVRGII